MKILTRDEQTYQAIASTQLWRDIVMRADRMKVAGVGAIDLEAMSDAEHERIRGWASGGARIEGAPAVILDYFARLEK